MSCDTPGMIQCKQFSDSNITTFKDPANVPMAGELPPLIVASGLSNDCQWYLYDKVRPFVQTKLRILHAHSHLFQGQQDQTLHVKLKQQLLRPFHNAEV